MGYRSLIAGAVMLSMGCCLLISCARHKESTATPEDPVAMRTQNPGAPRYDFERDAVSLDRIHANMGKVKTGDTPGRVIELLGMPTSDEVVGPKVRGDRTWRHRYLDYDVKRLIAGSANEKYDQVIEFVFDENDHEKLYSIHSTVPGIPDRGTLSPPTGPR
jgi:hypothetical protein